MMEENESGQMDFLVRYLNVFIVNLQQNNSVKCNLAQTDSQESPDINPNAYWNWVYHKGIIQISNK